MKGKKKRPCSILTTASKVNFIESQGGKNWEYYFLKCLHYPWSFIVLFESELTASSKSTAKNNFKKYQLIAPNNVKIGEAKTEGEIDKFTIIVGDFNTISNWQIQQAENK